MDVFVHHSSISVDNQYKYLVQGEYVEFELTKNENEGTKDRHKFHATKVSGIMGVKLMCDFQQDRINSRKQQQEGSFKVVHHKKKFPYKKKYGTGYQRKLETDEKQPDDQ